MKITDIKSINMGSWSKILVRLKIDDNTLLSIYSDSDRSSKNLLDVLVFDANFKIDCKHELHLHDVSMDVLNDRIESYLSKGEVELPSIATLNKMIKEGKL